MKETCSRKGNTPPVTHLKRVAKKLLKDYRSGDAEAEKRIRKVLLDRTKEPSLQNVQHVIAKECGFNNWAELLASYN